MSVAEQLGTPMETEQFTVNTMTTLKKIELPLGWNALINEEAKTALVIGEYKQIAEANTALTLLNKPTQEELKSAIEAAGLKVLQFVRTVPPVPTKK